jgi:PIN domain nuclease of toxin-antitoxin system
VIILDTHMWYWWVGQSDRLTPAYREIIESNLDDGLGLSVISCWEVAKKHQLGKLELDRPVDEWMPFALAHPGLALLPLSLEIVMDSTSLPGGFRGDPADEIIVATSRVQDAALLTADAKLIDYTHVHTLP